jgi:hypothetical protein
MQRIDNDVEVTTSVDTTSDIICGATTQLSILVVVQPLAAVGGIVELLQPSAPPAQQPGSASPPYAVGAGSAAAVALALTAGAWYAGRRRIG